MDEEANEGDRYLNIIRDCDGIWSLADAHRNGKRFIVRADEKLTAFAELEAEISAEALEKPY